MSPHPGIKPTDTIAMILAGGVGSRLSVLSSKRAKPAVPFGGIYRIIDFTISNVMVSGITVVGICTQYKPYSLMDHLSVGEAWGFARRGQMAKVLPPYTGEEDSDWYAGTADAIYQNIGFFERFQPKYVLILSGDHIYHMDYRPLIAFHREHGGPLTIACQEVPLDETDRFGIIVTDEKDRITGFQEKPKKNPLSNLANLGIYVFDAEAIYDRLKADARNKQSTHDFGNDVIPAMVNDGYPCYVNRFSGYWRDVGTVESFWDAHMESLDPESGLDISGWQVCTATKNLGAGCLTPAQIGDAGQSQHSVVSWGCRIDGTVKRSVLSPMVHVGADSVVEDSVVMDRVRIGKGCLVRKAIIDKASVIEDGAVVGHCDDSVQNPEMNLITLIGKQATITGTAVVSAGKTVLPGYRFEAG